jgi:hypothetical protein
MPASNLAEPAVERALDRIHPDVIDAHLRFLSHTLLEGRAP